MFWQSYTGGDLRLAAPPVGRVDPATTAAGQHRLEQLRAAATPTLLTTQAVLETCGWVGTTGPLSWSPPAAGTTLSDGVLGPAWSWSGSVGQDQDWGEGDNGIALAAALAAAEEDLAGQAFATWLWGWLDVNYGIGETEGNAFWLPAVWALRAALTDPDTEPAGVHHPALAAALRHTTCTSDGTVQRWQLLRRPRAADPERHLGLTLGVAQVGRWLDEPQDEDAAVGVDDGVQDQPVAVAVDGRPLIGRRVVGLRRAFRLVEQLRHPHIDLPLRLFRQSVVLLEWDL